MNATSNVRCLLCAWGAISLSAGIGTQSDSGQSTTWGENSGPLGEGVSMTTAMGGIKQVSSCVNPMLLIDSSLGSSAILVGFQ